MYPKISESYGPTDVRILVDVADIGHLQLNMRAVVRVLSSSVAFLALAPDRCVIEICFLQHQIRRIVFHDTRALLDRSRLLVPTATEDFFKYNFMR